MLLHGAQDLKLTGHFLHQKKGGSAGGILLLLEDVLSRRVWEICFSLCVRRGEKHM